MLFRMAMLCLFMSCLNCFADRPEPKRYSSASSWEESQKAADWFVQSREKLLPFTSLPKAGEEAAPLLERLGPPQGILAAHEQIIRTYSLYRLLFFQLVTDASGRVVTAHILEYPTLQQWTPDQGVPSGTGPAQTNLNYDVAAWLAVAGIDRAKRPDADHRALALNAVRRLVPEASRQDIVDTMGQPQATVIRPGREILVYRIGQSDFIHCGLYESNLLMGVDHRHYIRQSGRLVSTVMTGRVERIEAPDLVLGDWRAAQQNHIFGIDRVGLGKHLEKVLGSQKTEHVIDALGKPMEKRNEKTYYYDVSFALGFEVTLNPDGTVAKTHFFGD